MRRPPYKFLYNALKEKIPSLISGISPVKLSEIEMSAIRDLVDDWEARFIEEHKAKKKDE